MELGVGLRLLDTVVYRLSSPHFRPATVDASRQNGTYQPLAVSTQALGSGNSNVPKHELLKRFAVTTVPKESEALHDALFWVQVGLLEGI